MPGATTISLTDIAVTLSLGVPESERHQPQQVLISVTLSLDDDGAAWRDHLADTVDYGEIIAFLREDLPAEPPTRLIEAVADRVARHVLSLSPRVRSVDVSVKKPSVLTPPALVSVNVRRERTP